MSNTNSNINSNYTIETTHENVDNVNAMEKLLEGAHIIRLCNDKSMLAYYHMSDKGLQKFTKVWFDKNSSWYKNKLVPSGIKYPSEWFLLTEIPDDPWNDYRLTGSFGGSVTVSGNFKCIGRIGSVL